MKKNVSNVIYSQGLHQDVKAYEHVVDSAMTKAQDLAVTSPASLVSDDSTSMLQLYRTLQASVKVSLFCDMISKYIPKYSPNSGSLVLHLIDLWF